MFEQKDGHGALFKNEYKTKDSHPDYRGPCMINGVEMEIAAWVKPAKDGKKPFMSLNIQPKRERTAGEPVKEEDLPF